MANSKLKDSSFLLEDEDRELYNELISQEGEDSRDDISDEEIIQKEQFGKENIDKLIMFSKLAGGELEILQERIDTLTKRKKHLEARVDWFKEQADTLVKLYGIIVGKAKSKSIEGNLFKVSRVVNAKSSIDLDLLPEDFKAYKVVILVSSEDQVTDMENNFEVLSSSPIVVSDLTDPIIKDLKEQVKLTEITMEQDGITVQPTSSIKIS